MSSLVAMGLVVAVKKQLKHFIFLQDHVIKGSGDFMEGNSSLYIPMLPKLIVTDIVLMGI